MGFLERAIRQGIREGVGKAVGDAISKAIEPKATQFVNDTASHFDRASQTAPQSAQSSSGLEGALNNLERSMQGYATQMAKGTKQCPSCREICSSDKAFCPSCGAKLPEATVADGAVCTSCGKQNTVGTKFCSDCGAKLPAAVADEEATAERDAALMAEWDEKLSHYPKWNCGGCDFNIETLDGGYIMFAAGFNGDPNAAYIAVKQYREVLMQNGFRQAGQYPSIEHLYKKTGTVCCHVDTEHCFDGDSDYPTIYFDFSEPTGGYDYVKPEPKKNIGLKDLFKF